MRVIAPSADIKIPLRSGAKLNIKKGEYYVFAERFVLELTHAFSESIIGSEISMESLYVPYRGQDLHEKTLFCFRTSGIGDFLAVTTALRALKEKFPTVKIIAGSFETNRYLAESDPCIDEFVTVPYPAKYLQESDYVLQFQGIIENITQESKEYNFYDIFIKHSYVEDESFTVKNNLPKVFLNGKSEEKISALFEKYEIKRPSVGIQITTSSKVRNYPIQLLQRLIFLLTNALKLNVILIGAPSESPAIIIRNNLSDNKKSFDFAKHSDSVADFVSIVNHCDFIISPDTAALHIAGALGKPMIGLFGPIRSNLRISNFKNAIGLDSETICTPCFRHGNTPCRYALENGDSPCMYIIEPEKIIETVQNDMLPLFGFARPTATQAEQEIVDDPDFNEDAKKAIVTLAIGDQAKKMLEIAKPFFQKYAKKTNSDFIVIDQEKINVKFPNMEKFQMKEFLDKYDRIIYFDVDILIHPDCPDLFKIVPTKSVGFVPDSPDAKWNNLSRYRDAAIAQEALGDIGWTSGYFNSGVIVFSKEHKGLFDDPQARERMECQYLDQTLINYNFQKNKYTPFILDKKFNGMEIVGFSSRTNPQNKTNAMVMHFAHEGNVLEQMKEIAKLFDLEENDDEKQKKPIMFYDSGELGWSIYLAAHINYLIEKRIYGAVTVCAPKARHVLYKDIKNVITLDIPKEIKEQTKNLDQDGTHLYDHSTKQRVKNDVLHKIFQDYFKNYDVSPRFGFFNGERKFFKYSSNEEAKQEAEKILKNDRAILIFPRHRIGKFGKRNLSEDFYIELCRKLNAEYHDYKIISIGSKNGAYNLNKDKVWIDNFVNLVEYDDDKSLDLMIALCNSGKVDFAIGSQSSLPKISLLLGIPTYMIGHEKERHVQIENWFNTLVGFTEVSPDGYELLDKDKCILDILEFMKKNKLTNNEFEFDTKIICPTDPTATPERIAQYKEYYKVKYEICKEQNPKKIIEIGVRAGYSAWTFLQACPTALYLGYDANNGMHGGKGGEDGSFTRWTKKILAGYNFKLFEMDTQKVTTLGYNGEIDLFHVDGDHTIKGVMHDLDLAYEAISETGLILVDDITYLPEVKKGVMLWLEKMNSKVTSEFKKSLRGEMLIRKAN